MHGTRMVRVAIQFLDNGDVIRINNAEVVELATDPRMGINLILRGFSDPISSTTYSYYKNPYHAKLELLGGNNG